MLQHVYCSRPNAGKQTLLSIYQQTTKLCCRWAADKQSRSAACCSAARTRPQPQALIGSHRGKFPGTHPDHTHTPYAGWHHTYQTATNSFEAHWANKRRLTVSDCCEASTSSLASESNGPPRLPPRQLPYFSTAHIPAASHPNQCHGTRPVSQSIPRLCCTSDIRAAASAAAAKRMALNAAAGACWGPCGAPCRHLTAPGRLL